MSIDYGERERQFLDTLKADTGRSLDEWMAAIAAEGLSHRNDIIDWLRRQGFLFSKASWIERIHNNSGQPIYAGKGTARPRAQRRPATPRLGAPSAAPPPSTTTVSVAAEPVQAPASAQPGAAAPDPAAIDALFARAKAYRPLAVYVVNEIRKVVPDVIVEPRDGYLAFRSGATEFALLAISAKELRLGLKFAAPPAGAALETPRFAPPLKGAPPVTHMAVLTDARQITPALIAATALAASQG